MVKNIRQNNYGFVLLEIVISIALFSIVFITLLGIGFSTLNLSSAIQKETQADFLVKEEFEAIRNFRDATTWATNGLGAVNTGSSNPYYLVNNSTAWSLVAGTETEGIFTRKVVFDKVSRDASGDIESVYNELRNDSDTKKATVTITWPGKTMQVVSYFTNWKTN